MHWLLVYPSRSTAFEAQSHWAVALTLHFLLACLSSIWKPSHAVIESVQCVMQFLHWCITLNMQHSCSGSVTEVQDWFDQIDHLIGHVILFATYCSLQASWLLVCYWACLGGGGGMITVTWWRFTNSTHAVTHFEPLILRISTLFSILLLTVSAVLTAVSTVLSQHHPNGKSSRMLQSLGHLVHIRWLLSCGIYSLNCRQ